MPQSLAPATLSRARMARGMTVRGGVLTALALACLLSGVLGHLRSAGSPSAPGARAVPAALEPSAVGVDGALVQTGARAEPVMPGALDDVQTGAVAQGLVGGDSGSADPCAVCTYVLQNKILKQPYLCRGLKQPSYQKQVSVHVGLGRRRRWHACMRVFVRVCARASGRKRGMGGWADVRGRMLPGAPQQLPAPRFPPLQPPTCLPRSA